MVSWYIAHVFSKWLWNGPSRAYYYWNHLCFYIPRALYFYYYYYYYYASLNLRARTRKQGILRSVCHVLWKCSSRPLPNSSKRQLSFTWKRIPKRSDIVLVQKVTESELKKKKSRITLTANSYTVEKSMVIKFKFKLRLWHQTSRLECSANFDSPPFLWLPKESMPSLQWWRNLPWVQVLNDIAVWGVASRRLPSELVLVSEKILPS